MADRIKRIFGVKERHLADDSFMEDLHEIVIQVADSVHPSVESLPEEEQPLPKEELGEQEPLLKEPIDVLEFPVKKVAKEYQEPEEPPLPNPLDSAPTEDILHLLRDKVDEFRLLGYGAVSIDDLWGYFCGQKKRRPVNLHELVNAVLCLQPQQFMNYTMQEIYRKPFVLDDPTHLDSV